MGSSLGSGNRVNLVDDNGARAAEHSATSERRNHDVKRLGSRDENVRRFPQHARASRRGRIARSHSNSYLRKLLARLSESRAEIRERAVEVPLDVVVEGF